MFHDKHRARPLLLCFVLTASSSSNAAEPLPNTKPLTETGDLAAKMVDGIHKYLDRAIAASVEKRSRYWKPDFTSAEKYAASVRPNRERLKKYLGVVDQRLPPKMEYVGGPEDSSLAGETERYTVHAVRWAVLPGVDGEGLLLEPKKGKVIANVVALPDADALPEEMVGMAGKAMSSALFAARLAENGCRVIVPVLIDRKDEWSGSAKFNKWTNQPHREFIHRMAYEMGRTMVGYEVEKVLAAVDWFEMIEQREKVEALPIGVSGRGEGGLIALYAAAIDGRITATAVSGVFGPPGRIAEDPIYRNVWGLYTEFGDADIIRLVFPRPIITELVGFSFDGPPPVRAGRAGAAPGRIHSPIVQAVLAPELIRVAKPLSVSSEFPRIKSTVSASAGVTFGEEGIVTQSAQNVGPVHHHVLMTFLTNLKGIEEESKMKSISYSSPPPELRKSFDPIARQKRQFDQLVAYTQKLWRDSEPIRKAQFAKADASSPEAWDKSVEPLREFFHSEVIGKLPEPTGPLNPRTRQVYDEPTWRGYELMLDVYPDVFAYGILLLPKDLKPGERRPVVVCQHGLEGTPRSTIDPEKRVVYNQFSQKLVEKGYIVYAPQNPYYGKNAFRQINRKGNPLKLSLFSFINRQHQRTLDFLETLPNVDPKRIAFYGLSYGGKTAMRVPAVEKRYCLSICSGDFNEWIGKNASVDLDRSYMWTGEYEMYEFDLGHTFSYAEMAALIAPRPFMVERGHNDGVGTDEMVAYEFAKVRYLYESRLKLMDRAEIEFFNGVHEIRAKGTFAFLAKHLDWPGKN